MFGDLYMPQIRCASVFSFTLMCLDFLHCMMNIWRSDTGSPSICCCWTSKPQQHARTQKEMLFNDCEIQWLYSLGHNKCDVQVSESFVSYLDVVIGVCDESDEQTEHHVDEEWHKRVEIDPTEEPHHTTLLLHHLKRVEHVVSVYKRKQTLRHHVQSPELKDRERERETPSHVMCKCVMMFVCQNINADNV